jgi:Leucine-rich repeat (LRR) protein
MRDRDLARPVAVILSFLAMCSLSCGDQSSKGVVDDDADPNQPPTTVTDLSITAITPISASLQWTAPSVGSGMAYGYDVRYATFSINEGSWPSATIVQEPPPPLPAGMTQTMAVGGLMPQTPYHFALKSRSSLGNWSLLSNMVSATTLPEAEIVIPDSSLQAVVRDLIAKPTGPILTSDVVSITEIAASEKGIVSLSGLEAFTSLRFLDIRGNQVEDLNPVAGLASLAAIGASDNRISDIAPLSGITNLTQLSLGNDQVTDLQPLAGLANLEFLYLNGNGFTSLSALASLTHLSELYAGANRITDVSPVQNLTSLLYLNLDLNQIADLAPIVANTGLTAGDEIWVRMNPLSPEAINTQIPALEARGVTVHH